MLAVSTPRIDPKKRALVDPRKRQQSGKAQYQEEEYPHRLNFYSIPPTGDVSLEQFQKWANDRLKVLTELEACQFRNKTPQETEEYMRPVLDECLRLDSNSSRNEQLQAQRKKDHYSHWTLRLAFAATSELRQRFSRLEAALFKLRMQQDDSRERRAFIASLPMSWDTVTDEEKSTWLNELKAATSCRRDDEESWFKVDWELVPDLVERRQVLLKKGMAFVHVREQAALVLNEYVRNLDAGLEQASRALPRLDEDNRLKPILNHMSQSFVAPDAGYNETSSIGNLATITAGSIDGLAQHFPLCMQNLQRELKKNSHLKHFSRLQYTLFIKGIGLSLQECIVFWRKSFKLITDEKFKSEYLYNIRHAYGDVGGDANKRGKGYSPHSCQKLLTEPLPSAGQNHGCPYRTYSPDNLITLLQSFGVSDHELLRGVREDVGRQRYHIACNRVFEATHKSELKRVKDNSMWPASELDTILHPNTYFKRSYLLKHLDKVQSGDMGVDGPT